jgi:small-conductance mechanosensitive channel
MDTLPSQETLLAFLRSPATWWQLAILAASAAVAWFLGGWLQQRLTPVIRPGAVAEGPRTAVRTGALALVPLILWLMLLATTSILRRHGQPTDLLRPAMLLVGALAVVRMGVFVLRHSFAPGGRLKAWEGALTVTIWSLVALHILGWLPHIEQTLDEYAITVGQVRVSLYTLVSFTLSVAVLLLVALWLANAIQLRVMRSEALDESLKIALSKLSKFVLLTVALVAAMLSAGIDLTAFAVFGGALGVGLGLGLQRVVSNFVSGIILAFEGAIKPGDIISVGKTFGTVKALHARHIVVHTPDGDDILVPNENLLTSEITNRTYEGDRLIRLTLPLQVSYADDPERVMAVLMETAHTVEAVLAEPAPETILTGFGDNGIGLELRVWISHPEGATAAIRSQLYLAVHRAFHRAGITLPFPQRDVHLIPSAVPAASRSRDS